jgi:hypothetical protein
MSFVSPDAGVSVAGISVSAGPVAGGVHTADVLAFTGAGPGTFYLAIIGFASLVAGSLMSFFARRNPAAVTVQAPVNGLDDLSRLADRLEERREGAVDR